MKIEFYNCPTPQPLNTASLPEKPAFLSYVPDFEEIAKIAEEFKQYQNIILIGHGGSITSFYGIYHALREQSTKQVYVLSTIDPDYIAELKQSLKMSETLVIAISKSGETVTQIEALLQFKDFAKLFIAGAVGPLSELAEKLEAKMIIHPPISGRYTGMTEVALLPAALCGFDIRAIFDSAAKVYKQFQVENDAVKAASIMYQLEEKGIVDVFMPIYDAHLFAFNSLIVQLCHESFGKDGHGQTYFSHHAPESQHHTNQRFFGGRANIAGWFISSDKGLQDAVTVVPDNAKTIHFKESTMGALDGISLSAALLIERDATIAHAKLENIPVVNQTITQRNPAEVGQLIAFWQLYAIYSSVLRKVNPFDQPQVETSKKISFDKRLQLKGLL